MNYTVKDLRGQTKPAEVCRVCGSKEVHSTIYGNPTMWCIEALRKESGAIIDKHIDFANIVKDILNSNKIEIYGTNLLIKDCVNVNLRLKLNTWIDKNNMSSMVSV